MAISIVEITPAPAVRRFQIGEGQLVKAVNESLGYAYDETQTGIANLVVVVNANGREAIEFDVVDEV